MMSNHFLQNIKTILNYIKRRLVKGITLIQLNMEDLREIDLIVPPLSEQKSFVEFAEQVDKSKLIIMPSGIQLVDEIRQLFDSPTHDNFDEDNAYLDINYTIRE